MSSKILVVEDDTLLSQTLEDLLEEEGYEVTLAINGEEALEKTFNERFSLYLLDINLPLLDGVTLLKELRGAQDTTPAIFLTSHKKEEKLKEGFLVGGDDYITKPFENEELLLRIQALLRRTQQKAPKQVGDFTIENGEILFRNEPLELSKKEYDLLSLFLQNANKALPKEHIIETIWNTSESGSEGAIRVYINRLKKHLPQITIENIRGIGYKLVL